MARDIRLDPRVDEFVRAMLEQEAQEKGIGFNTVAAMVLKDWANQKHNETLSANEEQREAANSGGQRLIGGAVERRQKNMVRSS